MKTLFVCVLSVAMATGLLFGDDDEDMTIEAWGEVDPDCTRLADSNNCDFYKCFPKRFPCTRRLLEFGLHPTCRKMTLRRLDLNQEGRDWLNNSRSCFHAHLKTQYESSSLSCDQFQDGAIHAYMTCANTVTPNMCQIFFENRCVIGQVLHITVDELIDNPRTGLKNIYGLIRMMSGCGRNEVRSYLNELKSTLMTALRQNIRFPWD